MNNLQKPTRVSLMLVGVAFIFIQFVFIIPVSSQVSDGRPQLNAESLTMHDMREFHSSFTQQGPSSTSSLMKTEFPAPSQLTNQIDAQWRGKTMGASGDLATINSLVDRDLNIGGHVQGSGPGINYLDIDVGKVTVIAINMADGGNAVANSNIVIQPVQTQGDYMPGSAMDDLLR